MSIFVRGVAAVAAAGLVVGAANAAVTGFVANASGNSVDMANYVAAASQVVEHGVNFDSHPVGVVNSTFYQGGYGVTMTTSGWDDVAFGTGAASGSTNGPNSTGEGLLTVATGYLATSAHPSSVTVTFASPVLAAGFMTIDYYNPFGDNTMTVEAFDGANGTGTSLGSFNGLGFNFQLNYKYFMGIGSSTQNIKSIRLSTLGLYSDGVMIDEVAFSTVPGPGMIGAIGMMGLVAGRRRR